MARAGNGTPATAQLNAGLGLLNRSIAGRAGVELGVLSSVTGSVGANLTGGGAIGIVGRGLQAAASPTESTLKLFGLALPYVGTVILGRDAYRACR